METSSAEMGSSQTMNFGSTDSALAMPILCLCPPLNSCGKRDMWSRLSPTVASRCSMRSFNSLSGIFSCTSIPSPTMSLTVMRGFKDAYGFWKIICTFFLNARFSSLLYLKISLPS